MTLSRRAAFLLMLLLVAISTFLFFNPTRGNAQQPPLDWALEKLVAIWDKIQYYHAYPPEKTPEAVTRCVQKILQGGVSRCLDDPFAQYHTAADVKEMQIVSDGAFGGIGLQLEYFYGKIIIVAPIDGTPAQRSGFFRTGDVIVEVDGNDVRKETLEFIVNKIRGPQGTPVIIRVERRGILHDAITLTRAVIILPSVTAIDIDSDITYLRISQYNQRGLERFVQEQRSRIIGSPSRMNVVYDVRDNPGGLLEIVAHMCGTFADGLTDTLVMIKSRSFEETLRPISIGMPNQFIGIFKKTYPINAAVLTNKGTASASEIFAVCARENINAIIVGENSFGKGSVQTIIPLQHGDALRLTTHRYFVTGKRIAIDRVGINPDYIVKSAERADGSLVPFKRGNPNEDLQLKEAIRLLRERAQ